MQVRTAGADLEVDGATIVIGVMEGLLPAPGSETMFGGVDVDLLEAAGFEGKTSQTMTVSHPEAKALLLVGLGDEADYDRIRAASGNAVRAARTTRLVTHLAVVGVEGATRAVVEGSVLGGFQFRAYKTNDEKTRVEEVEVIDGDPGELAEALIVADATNMARTWVNTPAKDMSPVAFAQEVTARAGTAGLGFEVWDKDRIETEGLGALLGVAAGSDREPRLVTLTYRPEGSVGRLALVGKGITFDSGGLSLKPSAAMEEMKVDMSGAAAVVAATMAIAGLGLPIEVTTITPLTDNAVGGDATRPGDVLRPVEGPTIEVLNTDAEGRLVLADGLSLARRHDPDLIVDVATLTGAMRVALGDKIAGFFASDREVAAKIAEAAARAGEPFWEMPLHKDYRRMLDSTVADIKNVTSTRYGGAIAAALFLAEYVKDTPWAHLDIAGPAVSRENSGEQVKGGSGVAVRTLVELARAMAGAV
ncbi:MAG: leucyl aminopeptidase [Actinobacteria bacterium]|nr:leucyl aminopeptidase [Actinomycetota bacterium]